MASPHEFGVPADRPAQERRSATRGGTVVFSTQLLQRRWRGNTRPPHVLLLTSELGAGHLRCSQAIAAAIGQRMPAATIRSLDFWSLMNHGVAKAIQQTYLQLVSEYPQLYDRIHGLDEHTWRQMLETNTASAQSVLEALTLVAGICPQVAELDAGGERYASDRMLYPLLCSAIPDGTRGLSTTMALRVGLVKWVWSRLKRRLATHINALQPDVVVSTQMLPAALLASVKRRRHLSVPGIAVPTDFGLHDFWLQAGTDHYCVAHEDIATSCGLHATRVSATGVPLMPGFRNPPSMSQARYALQLPTEQPAVLILGGGLGLGIEALTTQLLHLPVAVRLIAVTGRNSQAEAALRDLATAHPRRLHVVTWTNRIERLMRAADIVVGKPGGLTTAEVLACGRPLFATRSLGGQEGFNARFLEAHEVGRLLPENELVPILTRLLDRPRQLHELQERAWQVGRRDGADQVAEIALEHALWRMAAPESRAL